MTSQAKTSTAPQGAARLLRYLAMPIFLGLAGLALYVYVGIHGLDSIEQRSLNAGTLIQQTARLIELAAVSTAIVVTLSVTTGILLTRPFARHVSPFVIGLANIGQAVPSIGVLAFLAIVLTGIRTALIINVGTATLGAFIGAGGLGESINNAISLDRTVVLVTASGLTAIVALSVDWLAGVAEDVLRPKGL